MRFHVIGIGAIGSLVSFHLRRTLPKSTRICLIVRKPLERPLVVERDGVKAFESDYETELFETPRDLAKILLKKPEPSRPIFINKGVPDRVSLPSTDPKHIHSLIITTKAPNTVQIVEKLAPKMSNASTIVLLQNGMGVYEAIINRCFRNPRSRPHFVIANTTHGAYVKNTGHIVHSGVGELYFGIVPDPQGRDFEQSLRGPQAELNADDIVSKSILSNSAEDARYQSLRATICALGGLTQLHPIWEPISDMYIRQRKKLVVNACVNPLTALLQCRNGLLYGRQSANQVIKGICDEAAAVFLAEARENRGDPTYSGIPQLRSVYLYREVQRVIGITAGNFSSMLRDVQGGKVTEVAYLNGYISALGTAYGIPTPKNDLLVELLRLQSKLAHDARLF